MDKEPITFPLRVTDKDDTIHAWGYLNDPETDTHDLPITACERFAGNMALLVGGQPTCVDCLAHLEGSND